MVISLHSSSILPSTLSILWSINDLSLLPLLPLSLFSLLFLDPVLLSPCTIHSFSPSNIHHIASSLSSQSGFNRSSFLPFPLFHPYSRPPLIFLSLSKWPISLSLVRNYTVSVITVLCRSTVLLSLVLSYSIIFIPDGSSPPSPSSFTSSSGSSFRLCSTWNDGIH